MAKSILRTIGWIGVGAMAVLFGLGSGVGGATRQNRSR
jgi:hypothetical protein